MRAVGHKCTATKKRQVVMRAQHEAVDCNNLLLLLMHMMLGYFEVGYEVWNLGLIVFVFVMHDCGFFVIVMIVEVFISSKE